MAFKCLLVTVVLGLLHGLVGLGALASHAQANPVYEITARWADGELTQARSGESVVSEWRISVNDDAAAPSNDPVDDVTFTVTATNGVFTSIPGPCLTEEVTTPSSISADGTALTCNLGTLNMGTAVVAQIPVVVDGAVGDELGLSGDIGELTASPDTTIQITGDFGMDITWQNPTSWARWLNNDTTIRVDYQWTLNLLNGSEAGPNSVSYTLDLDPSTGGTITALACVPFQFDMASGHPWSAGDFPPEQTAPYVDTCTLTSTGVANQFTMTLTGIDYSLTQVPTMDSGGNLLPTDRSAIASGRIVFDMPATTAGSISLTSSTPTYTSVSGATYTDDGGNNTVSKTFALPGGWASAYMRVHTGQGGTNWDYTYWAAPGTTLSVNNHSRLHTNSNNLGLQMQQCTVLDTNYVTYSDTNPHVPGTSNEDGTGRHLGDGTGRWIDGEFEYTRWYYVGNHGSVTPGSATYDPETFAANCELDPGGWTTTLPADLSTVKAVRLSYQITGDLYEFHSIVMRTYPTIKADAPVGQDIWQFSSYRLGTNAWNYNTTQVITPTPGARYPHTNAWRDVVRVAGVEPYLEKSVDRAVVQVGEPFVYTIGYAANGDAAAPETVDGFTIVDMLPLGVEYVPGSSSIGEPTITVHDSGRQVLTWTLDGVPTNQLHAFTFQAVATEDAPTGVILRNRVDASLDGLNAIPKVADVTLSESGSTTIGKTADQAYIPNLDGDGVGTGSWTVTLRSYDTETQDFTDTIDILPYNGDERGTDFTGTYTLTGVTALPGATVYYTTADPATLSDDPADPSNGSPGDVTGNTVGWTTVFTPDATAVRVIGPELAPGETQSFTITIATSGATGGDVLVNRAHGRTEHTELSMLTSSLTSVANYYSASLKKYVQDADGVWRDAEVVEDYPSFIVGDEVTYLITVENTGEGTLTGIVVDDDRYPEEGGFTIDTLAPGETASHEFTVVATEEMQELSPWVNVASASADIPEDSEVAPTINVDQAGIEIEAQAPELTLVKSAEVVDVNGNALTDAGDEIWYSFTVTNDGNVTLTDVSVDDPLLADAGITITCDPTTLLPGDSVVCTADAAYVITQADVDAGAVENVAIVDATAPDGSSVVSNESSTVVPTDQVAAIDLVKTADAAELVAGETVTYTFTATNIGNVTLTDVVISETSFSGSGEISELTCDPDQPATLAPTESITCTASYVVTQADVDAGQVHNQASVSGVDPDGETVTDTDTADVPAVQVPAASLVKSAEVVDVNGNALTDAGDEIWYSFTVTNDGNVTLTEVSVDDPLLAANSITITCDPTTLAPGESVVCTADAAYVITQADVDAGAVLNTAIADATAPDGSSVVSNESSTVVPTDQVAAIDLVKTADAAELVAGETVTYTFTATNIGNVTLTDVSIVDDVAAFTGSGEISELTCDPDQPATLAPGEQLTCTATYVVTQADVDAGQVHNQADVSGLDPDGGMVTDADTADVPGELAPAYTLVKSAEVVDVNGNALTDAGDEIWYSFELVNTGNVTLTEVSVDDPLLADAGITITCDPTTLLPGESVVCTADAAYVITQADVDAGGVHNVATGSVQVPPGSPEPEDPTDENLVPTDQVAGIDLVKSADATELVAGETVTYTFTATNIGNVTLTDVVISETSFTGSGEISELSCDPDQPAVLLPGEQLTCTATYVVTQADVDAGQVHNQADVSGLDPDGGMVTDADTADVPGELVPAYTLVKSAEVVDVNGNALTDAGDEIWYSFELVNTGNVTLTEVSVDDPLLAANSITITCDPTTLLPGESVVCTADAAYVITQADVDAGGVHNVATGSVQVPPGSPEPEDPTDENLVPTDQVAGIDLVKSADATELVAGETVTYTFTATNIGNVTLTDVVISETSFTGSGEISELSCDPDQPAVLLPGEQLTCTATYVVTQADVDAGQVHNQADVSGLDPDGGMVTDADTADVPGELVPAYTLVKSAEVVDVNGNALTDAGDEIWYAFELVNTGNVTLTEVSVDDPLLADAGITITCDPTTLAPGESVICTADAAYVITQADVDAGGVHNVATGSVQVPPDSPEPEDPTDENEVRIDQTPGYTLVKLAEAVDVNGNGLTDAGDEIWYSFEIVNTGNVTLTEVSVDDPLLADAGITITCDPSTLAPGETVICTADTAYVITQADVDAGGVHNVATGSVQVPPGSPEPEDHAGESEVLTATVEAPGADNPDSSTDEVEAPGDNNPDSSTDDVEGPTSPPTSPAPAPSAPSQPCNCPEGLPRTGAPIVLQAAAGGLLLLLGGSLLTGSAFHHRRAMRRRMTQIARGAWP